MVLRSLPDRLSAAREVVVNQLFIVRLGEQRYALPLEAVERVLRMVEITEIPDALPPVLGVINVQGRVLTVVDLRACLHLPTRESAPEDVLVIAATGGETMALAADGVEGVVDRWGETEAAGATGLPAPLRGVAKLTEGLVLIWDLERLVAGHQDFAPVPAGARQAVEEESAQRRHRILRERSQRLAREPETEEGGERYEVVEFLLGNEHYGMETAFVREVHPLRDLTPLPCTPGFVAGIVSLRGEILSVIDLRELFELERGAPAEPAKVVVVRGAGMEFGILVDLLVGVRSVPASRVQPPVTPPGGPGREYLKGVTAERLALLDAAKMLADRRLVVHEEV